MCEAAVTAYLGQDDCHAPDAGIAFAEKRMTSDTPSVELAGVTKRFGELVAVDDLSLEFGAGEFFTLLGPSGCGKTTTLRMIAGFETAQRGEIRIDGADVESLPPHRRPTNTVFQSYALFPHLSVADNVAFGLKRKKVPKAEISKRVGAELERVGLGAEARRRPAQLSGGSNSASPWREPSSTCPRCCSSTSRSAPST